ncbi:MAG: type I-A CRISPR-associated protein Cas7/Csa2 [Caldisphaera sp.]
MTYIRISGRFTANIAVLTGSENIGNYNTHAIAKVGVAIGNEYREYEVPVITGNSLKHWHSVYLAQVYEALGGNKLNEYCRKGIGLRGYTFDCKLSETKEAENESTAIKDLCNDIHGFLNPNKQIKRDSLVKFSFAAPVFDQKILEISSRYAETHNRVDSRSTQNTGMMIFKQEYSSSPLYGFNISMNLGYVCKPMYEDISNNTEDCDDNEIILRKKSSILSLLNLLTGFGSKQARAMPITEVKELLLAYSEKPIPNVVHGSYVDYANKSLEILKAYAKANANISVYCYGIDCEDAKKDGIEVKKDAKKDGIEVKKEDSLEDLFNDIINKIDPSAQKNQSQNK